jgi:hypothetical protein
MIQSRSQVPDRGIRKIEIHLMIQSRLQVPDQGIHMIEIRSMIRSLSVVNPLEEKAGDLVASMMEI